MITLNKFGGLAPRYPAPVLQLPYAITAQNCNVDDATLTPVGSWMNAPWQDPINAETRSLAFYIDANGQTRLLSFPQENVVVEQHALPNDQYRRAYWCIPSRSYAVTGAGVFYGAYTQVFSGLGPFPGAGFLLGVPAPTGQPIYVRNAGAGNATPETDGKTPYYRRFTYTVVSQFGEESGPYLPDTGTLETVILYEGDTVSISSITSPSGNYALGDGSLKRVYMTDTSGNFRLMAELPLAHTSLTLDHMIAGGVTLGSAITAPAPQDMQGMKMAPQGFLVGWAGSTLYVSEALKYHSWPVAYQKVVPSKILGAVPVAAGLILVCEFGVYLAVGNDPANLNIAKISTEFGCVSSASIVDMGGTAVFSSPSGVVACDGSSVVLVTKELILPRQWGVSPFTLGSTAVRHDGKYMFGPYDHTFLLAPKQADGALVELPISGNRTFNIVSQPVATHPQDGRAYVAWQGAVHAVESAGSLNTYRWKSPVMLAPGPETGTCVKVVFATTWRTDLDVQVAIKIWVDGGLITPADGVVITKNNLRNNEALFRLPPYRAGRRWEFEVAGSIPLVSIAIANRFRDFKDE